MSWHKVFALLVIVLANTQLAANDSPLQFGFAKAEITPRTPQRLSGYGSRTEPFEGIDESLFVRAMALEDSAGTRGVLVAVDTIGLPGTLVEQVASEVNKQHGIPRAQFVVCFSHTHTGPQIAEGITNIFAKPLTAEERRNCRVYTERLAETLVKTTGEALEDLSPGKLYFAQGKVEFARNRRVVRDGTWAGFGVNPDGPVDHALPILKVVDPEGTIRGIVFNYACHCTTFGGDHNRVNGDWAGYAAKYLEAAFPEASALCTIGCGADANPPRDRSRAAELAQAAGHEIAEEVQRLVGTSMTPITEPLSASFDFADLPFDLPTVKDLKVQLDSSRPQARRHAQNMLAIHQREGSLPATYAAPLQTWQFGSQLNMVFLSGEVVVDYALRLKRELAPTPTWVTAYANDLFAYVATERVREEGGYEVDGSMIYYNLPGRWASGTEELVIRRVHELLRAE